MESPPTPRSIDSDELFAEPSKIDEDIKSSKQSDHDEEKSENVPNTASFCIIKNGMYSGHLAKVTSQNKKCGRFNMRLVSPLGHYCRRRDGTVMHTALARASFDYLNVSESMINESKTLDMVLEATGSSEAIRVRKERLDLGEKLVFTVSSEYKIRSDGPNAPSNSRSIPRPKSAAKAAAKASAESSEDEIDESKPRKREVEAPTESDPNSVESESVSVKIESPVGSELLGFPCLWYGENEEDPEEDEGGEAVNTDASGDAGGEVKSSRHMIKVLPLALPREFSGGYAELLDSIPSVDSNGVGITTPSTSTSASLSQGSSTESSVYQHYVTFKLVRRDQLIALDPDEVAENINTSVYPLVAGYLLALLTFVEWAEFFKDSFHWPSFATRLFLSEKCVSEWFDFVAVNPILTPPPTPVAAAVEEVLASSEENPEEQAVKEEISEVVDEVDDDLVSVKNAKKLFLLLLCADHVGLLDPSTLVHLTNGQATKEVKRLMTTLTAMEKSQSNSGGGSGGKSVYRSSSRVGIEYQTTVALHPSPLSVKSEESTGSTASYSEHSEDVIESYLGQIQLLQEKYICVGQMVEVPVNFADFNAKFEKFLLTFEERVFDLPGTEQYRKTKALRRFMEDSRRCGSRSTTVAVVKRLSSGTTEAIAAVVSSSSGSSSSGGGGGVVMDVTSDPTTSSSSSSASTNSGITAVPAPVSNTLVANLSLQNEEYIALRSHVRYCRFFNLEENHCLEILHSVNGDISVALQQVEALLSASSSPPVMVGTKEVIATGPGKLSLEELKIFGTAVRIYPNNFNKAYVKYCKSMIQHSHLFAPPEESDSSDEEEDQESSTDGNENEKSGGDKGSPSSKSLESCSSGVEVTSETGDADTLKPDTKEAKGTPGVEEVKVDTIESHDGSGSGSDDDNASESSEEEFKPVLKSKSELLKMFFLFFPGWSEGRDRSGPTPVAVNALTASSLMNYGRTLQPTLDHSKFHVASTEFVGGLSNTAGGPAAESAANGKSRAGAASSGQKPPLKPSASSNTVATSSAHQSVPRRDPTIPNRWPSSLPLMSHNMYWLKTSNSPCMCVGLDENSLRTSGDGLVTIITVCCATYHHAVSVPASKLEPLDEDIIKQCSDERAVGFALAMMDFADYELQTLPLDSMLRRWYIFPAFIRHFLHNMQVFASWRKQVERANRDTKADRRKVYYNGLVETYNANIESEMKDIRLLVNAFPWDDTPMEESESESESGSEEDSVLSPPATNSAIVDGIAAGKKGKGNGIRASSVPSLDKPLWPKSGQKRKLDVVDKAESNSTSASIASLTASNIRASAANSAPASTATSVVEELDEEEEETKSVQGIGSSRLFNLFWISKSKLPCLYYDELVRDNPDKITVLPICCSTYHYPVEVVQSYLEPLRVELLRQCTDDRTHDFTLALIEFAKWDCSESTKASIVVPVEEEIMEVNDENDASPSPPPPLRRARQQNPDFYEWPEFLEDLLNQPKVWAVWRKTVERSSVGRPGARPFFYFEQLKADYLAQLNVVDGEDGSEGGAERMDASV